MMIHSKSHLEYVAKQPYEELKRIAENISNYYDPFIIRKYKDGKLKEREICPSKGVLKRVQTQIYKGSLGQIPLPWNLQGGIKGRDNTANALLHKGNKYKFCTDFKSYFPSIHYKVVYQTLVELGYSHDIASIITKLTTYNGSVPQGAPTSSCISNLVFLKYDRLLAEYCEERNITYTRYIDDLTFSAQHDFSELVPQLMQIIFQSPFKISHKKTFYTRGKAKITGLIVGPNSIKITDEFRQKMNSAELSDESREGCHNYERKVQRTNKKKKKHLRATVA